MSSIAGGTNGSERQISLVNFGGPSLSIVLQFLGHGFKSPL